MKTESVARELQDGATADDGGYNTLFDQQELACRWRPDTTLTYVNEAYCRYFGKREAELIGESFLSLIPETEREALQTHIGQLLASVTVAQPAVRYEHPVETVSGEIRWQEWVDRAIFDRAGHLVELQSVGRDITDRKRTEEALRQSQRQYETLVSNLPGLVYRCRHDESWTMEFASAGCLALTGFSSDDFVRTQKVSWMDLVHPDDLQPISAEMDAAIRERRSFELVYRIITAAGKQKWVWEQGQAIFEADDHFSALEGFITDITDQIEVRQALDEQREKALVTLSSIGDAVITTDAEGNVGYLNTAAEDLTGWSREEAKGKRFGAVCRILNEQTRAPIEDLLQPRKHRTALNAGGNAILLNRDGLELAVEETVNTIPGPNGKMSGMVAVFRDVTEARQMQRRIVHQATHDSLTDLVNRYEFEERLQQLLTDARNTGAQHALCYVDLDQFKVVNDTCGHVAGDELLRQLAATLRTRVRDSDTLARLGGDEFGILLNNCRPQDARDRATSLLEAIQDFRFVWGDSSFSIGASVGVVPVECSGSDDRHLLSAADAACYEAKDSGRNRVHLYESGDTELAERQGEMHWVSRIQQAIKENQLELFYQTIAPLAATDDDGGIRYELLLRMRETEDALIPPGAFLPAAERYNLMPLVDRWVVQRAFNWLSSHRAHADDLKHCAINLSGASLSDERFLDFVVEQFATTRVSASKICFEITETAAVANLVRATHFITTMKEMGCSFALDDFGSGMSSFAYLKKLPVDFLKIEGMFVRDIADDPIDFAMVKSINELGHAMGKRTIAEFAESQGVLEKLRQIGVDFAQGYALARPAPLIR